MMLNVGSGGTDICTGIVQGYPLLPVYAGEMAGKLPRRRRRPRSTRTATRSSASSASW